MSIALYHWSPTPRRRQIERYGLRPGCWSIDRVWKAPYIAFADSPSLAWSLSGGHQRGQDHPSWDLWMTWSDRLAGYEELTFDNGLFEARVYERIYKRDVWYVATRLRDRDRATDSEGTPCLRPSPSAASSPTSSTTPTPT